MISSIGSSNSLAAMQSMAATKGTARPAPPDPQEMFSKLDTDGDGKVSLEELKAMSESMPAHGNGEAPSAENILSGLDTDGDGTVSFAEFEAGRPPERPQGPPPWMSASGSVDLEALYSSSDEQTGDVLLAMMA
jgi:hypothetical protein